MKSVSYVMKTTVGEPQLFVFFCRKNKLIKISLLEQFDRFIFAQAK